MPNYCSNSFVITPVEGNEENLKNFINDFLFKSTSENVPVKCEKYIDGSLAHTIPLKENDPDHYDYDQAIALWGQKWTSFDSGCVRYDLEKELTVSYSGITAWSLPEAWFYNISAKYHLNIKGFSDEPGCGIYVKYEFDDGDVIEQIDYNDDRDGKLEYYYDTEQQPDPEDIDYDLCEAGGYEIVEYLIESPENLHKVESDMMKKKWNEYTLTAIRWRGNIFMTDFKKEEFDMILKAAHEGEIKHLLLEADIIGEYYKNYNEISDFLNDFLCELLLSEQISYAESQINKLSCMYKLYEKFGSEAFKLCDEAFFDPKLTMIKNLTKEN